MFCNVELYQAGKAMKNIWKKPEIYSLNNMEKYLNKL